MRDMALDRHCRGAWPEPTPQQEAADYDAPRDHDRLAEPGRDTFTGSMRDVADRVRDPADNIGEPVGESLGDVPGDIELRRTLVEQVEGLSQLEAFAPELMILGIDVLDLARLGDLVHVLHHLLPALLESIEAVLGGQIAEDAAPALELVPGGIPVRGERDGLGVERARNLHRPPDATSERVASVEAAGLDEVVMDLVPHGLVRALAGIRRIAVAVAGERQLLDG